MFSIARSRYTLPTQFVFIATNALGVLFSTIYNANTPDLYPNNAHHKLGWFVTWVLSAQVLVSLLGRLAGAFQKIGGSTSVDAAERHSFIPVSQTAMDEHHRLHGPGYDSVYRHSNDSAQGTEPNTESLRSHSFSSTPDTLTSPTAEYHAHKEFAGDDDDDDDVEADLSAMPRSGPVRNFAVRVGSKISSRAWRVLIFGYNFVDRTSMILGFITLATGIITLARFFVSEQSEDDPLLWSRINTDFVVGGSRSVQRLGTLDQGRYFLLVGHSHPRAMGWKLWRVGMGELLSDSAWMAFMAFIIADICVSLPYRHGTFARDPQASDGHRRPSLLRAP